ncbi:MAG: hypothetical protein V9G19_19350 [Tetrasphaera sp.]
MYAQFITFQGPRSPELLAAAERAGRERISPLIAAHPELREGLLGGFRAMGPDGHEVFVTLARSEHVLDILQELVMTSELLPGEDAALLPGPDRIERYEVADTMGPIGTALRGDA